MCGIAGFHVKDPSIIKKHEGVEIFVDELLKGIEHRGRHATGFVSVGFDGRVALDKSPVTASDFIKDRERVPEGVRTVLLHTRHWTKGKPEHTENNHPVVFGTCFAVHNGHINNDDELFKEWDLKRNAEVDSIIIPAAADFHGIGNPDDIKATLEALEGGFATAIINPVHNKGRVVIAKGKNSPLYVVDHPSFIVWASEKDVIKGAWGKVLGTPPNDKKIEQIAQGTFIIVDDTEVTRESFTVKERPFVPRPNPLAPIQRQSGPKHGPSGSGFGFGRHVQIDATPVAQAREAIQEFIKAGGTARTFDDRQNGLIDDDDLKDVKGAVAWHTCYGCNRWILKEDIIEHESWGKVCIDCEAATKREIAKQEAIMQDTWEDDDVCAGTTVPRIAAADRDALEVWADHENSLHKETLEAMYQELGSYYTTKAIEFLCFYTTPEYRDVAGAAVNALITELRELYEETYFDIVGESFPAEGDACAVPQESNDHPLLLEAGAQQRWRFCFTHNVTWKSEEGGCHLCIQEDDENMADEAALAAILDRSGETEEATPTNAASTEIGVYLPWERGRDTIITRSARTHRRSSGGTAEGEKGTGGSEDGDGEVIELPRCPICHTFVLRAGVDGCVVCRESAQDDGADVPGVGAGLKCIACLAYDAKVVIEYAGKSFHYCNTCYHTCNKMIHAEDKTVTLCPNDTNHMLKDGTRVCHIHVRKQSGSVSDTTMRKRGASITEVK